VNLDYLLLILPALAIVLFVFLTFLLIGKEKYLWSVVTCVLLSAAVYWFVQTLLTVAPELA
jgi:hypothetical protein